MKPIKSMKLMKSTKLTQSSFRRILCCIMAVAVVAASALSLYSCEDTSIYKLTALLSSLMDEDSTVGGDGTFAFESDVTFRINKEYMRYNYIMSQYDESFDMLPDEMSLSISGAVRKYPELNMAADIVINNDEELKTTVYAKGGELYFELNTAARIAADLLVSTGLVNGTFFSVFTWQVDYTEGSVIYFDISDFDFSYFREYILEANEFISAQSEVSYMHGGADVNVEEYDESRKIYFDDIRKAMDKELTKLSGYRFVQLDCVINPEDGENYLDIVATNEFGDIKRLERVPVDCKLDDLLENPESYITADILPLRYIFELLGHNVEWNDREKKAIILSPEGEEQLACSGPIINNKMYVNPAHLLIFNYDFEIKDIGEYIEFKISLKTE